MRNKGTVAFSASIEPQSAAPLDARMVCQTVADLLLTSTWTANDGSTYSYVGMVVTVYADPNTSLNGSYRLNNADYTQSNNWIYIGGIASQPEVDAGLIDTKAVSPLGLNSYMATHVQTTIDATLDLYVDGAVISSGDGLSWGTAFKTIAEAISHISVKVIYAPVNINIQGGTYNEGINLSESARLNNRATITFKTNTSDVILTGIGHNSGTGSQHSVYIRMLNGFVAFIGATGRRFVIRPNTLSTTNYYGFYVYTCSDFQTISNFTFDCTNVTATVKNGIWSASSKINLLNCIINNFTNAINVVGNCLINTSGLTGTDNTNAVSATTGAFISWYTGNTISGQFILSSAIMVDSYGRIISDKISNSIMSAPVIFPTGRISHVTGTVQINTITPIYAGAITDSLILIPDEVFTLGITGNISTAVTAEIGKTIHLIYDANTAKWYPQQIGTSTPSNDISLKWTEETFVITAQNITDGLINLLSIPNFALVFLNGIKESDEFYSISTNKLSFKNILDIRIGDNLTISYNYL